mmetsp:Transcript_5574/g.6368  ORF Transcript_5574/g.6368 Transcript_5574/m.6368 type:complete len:120 (-) Transcript_5574:226-585(-)
MSFKMILPTIDQTVLFLLILPLVVFLSLKVIAAVSRRLGIPITGRRIGEYDRDGFEREVNGHDNGVGARNDGDHDQDTGGPPDALIVGDDNAGEGSCRWWALSSSSSCRTGRSRKPSPN